MPEVTAKNVKGFYLRNKYNINPVLPGSEQRLPNPIISNSAHYGETNTTPLTAEVTASGANAFDFALEDK